MYLKKNSCSRLVFIDFDVTMATTFERQFSQKIENSFLYEENSLIHVIFIFLAHNIVSRALGKSKMAVIWQIVTLLPPADLKGDIFERSIHPPSFTVIAFILA